MVSPAPRRREAEKAIAVFDSGVGGLTVFKALRRTMPGERLIYFGDTARLPYGSKSKEVVRRFSLEIAGFLCRQDIKLYVVACNSATALALPALKARLKIPVLGVIQPAVRAAVAASASRVVGVIATEATITSGVYQRELRRLLGKACVPAAACPLLVPLVEEGWWEHPVTARVAGEYLRPLLRTRMDSLILGCTHYPLIRPLIARIAGPRVRLIDSAEAVACEADALLESRGLRRQAGRGCDTFYVTDAARRFRILAQRILGGDPLRVRLVRFPF
jgi:glutamate racemase